MPNTLWNVWTDVDPIKIKDTQLTLKGFSIAALRTNFYIPELGIMFDAGLSGNMDADYILVTHCHSDHTANIPFHTLKPNYIDGTTKKIQIYSPPESCSNVDKYITQLFLLSCQVEKEDDLPGKKTYDMNNATEGLHQIIVNKRPHTMEVIKCSHAVPCVGYGLIETRSKLKAEYQSKSKDEIRDLAKQKVQITENLQIPYFLYLGDTDYTVLSNKAIEKYKTIMIECTFLVDDDLEQAGLTQHMHWSQLKPYVLSHAETTFILYHFSLRYKKSQINSFFETEMKAEPSLTNIVVWNNNSD